MLNLTKTKMRVIAMVALFTLALIVGAASAHAQVFCQLVQAHPDGDLRNVRGPYGWYQVIVPCIHWIRVCN